MSLHSPACGRGYGEGKLAKRFHERALTPALSRKRERGERMRYKDLSGMR